jgi:hypothetical protein
VSSPQNRGFRHVTYRLFVLSRSIKADPCDASTPRAVIPEKQQDLRATAD